MLLFSSCSTVGVSLQQIGGHTMKCGVNLAVKCDESALTRPFIIVPSIFPMIAVGFPIWSLGYVLEENTDDFLAEENLESL
jgi:hypothetical protein